MGKLSPSDIKFYLAEAKSCEDRQKTELCQRNNYPFLINYYEGIEQIDAAYPHVSKTQKLSIINEYFPNTNSLISEIMYQNPDIIIEALKPEAEEAQHLMKSALQYGFNKSDALIENRVALFDMFFAGYCAVEVDHLTEDNGKTSLSLIPEEGQMLKNQQGMMQKAINKIKQTLNPEQAEENLAKEAPEKEEAFGTVEKTYVQRWSPLDVPLDWRARNLKERRYNLKKVWLSKAEFDAKYPSFKDKVTTESTNFDYAAHEQAVHSKKVLLYEFQVKKRGNEYWTIIVCPTITSEEIDIFKRPYTTNGFNMKIGTLHKYGKLYPISFAQVNKKMQDEMNHYVRFMMEVAERNIPKRLYDKNKVKVDALAALESTKVNDLGPVDGSPVGAVQEVQPTSVSIENKELLAIFKNQKEKLWSVSESKIGGKSNANFMGEVQIQEQGFQNKQIDVQEGLRGLIREELDTFKDIIVSFWDGQFFFKVTSGDKPEWYVPKMGQDPGDPSKQIVLNPLTDLLTGDYYIDVDISSSLRPNKDRRKAEIVDFLKFLFQPGILQFMQSQGKTINIDEIKKIAREFNFNPETLLIDYQPPAPIPVPGAGGAPGQEQLTPEEDAKRQAIAEAIVKERSKGG
ncbi:MAG: hypothetical protein ABIA66_00765 [Candidatus Omnitrophota bacterium]